MLGLAPTSSPKRLVARLLASAAESTPRPQPTSARQPSASELFEHQPGAWIVSWRSVTAVWVIAALIFAARCTGYIN